MVYSAIVHVAEALHPARCRLSLGSGTNARGETRSSPPTWARVSSAVLLKGPSHAIELRRGGTPSDKMTS